MVTLTFKNYDIALRMPEGLRAKTLLHVCGELKCREAACPKITRIMADARMPQHSHGMPTAPRVEFDTKGNLEIVGLYFQMSGGWQLSIDLEAGGLSERQRIDVIIP
ncbi:hypothetical protein [Rhodopseudomonas palustris]|uniref:hypothetical protein n=1 Tax=Rhodopseudomonas palustris TaxID=1076 RepID=UPI00131A943E|nr:hypothetical protein [Rhodopseudomonas palustris]